MLFCLVSHASSTFTFGILTYPYSVLLFNVSLSFISSIMTTSVIIRRVGCPKHWFSIFISTVNVLELWCSTECLHSGDSSFLFSQLSKCSFVLSHMPLPVWPRYFFFTSSLSLHSLHMISYTHPRVLQLMFSPFVHITQFVLLHPLLLNGSLRCSILFSFFPDLSCIFIFIWSSWQQSVSVL